MKIVITDCGFANIIPETAAITEAGFELAYAQCKTADDDVLSAAADADGSMVQWAPVTAEIIHNRPNLFTDSEDHDVRQS